MKKTPLRRKQPLTRKTRLRTMSKKRRKLMSVVGPARKLFVASVGACMVCRDWRAMQSHEIASGYAREKCLEHLDLQIAVCANCHEIVQHAKPAEQIAIRVLWDIDYRANLYNTLMGRVLVEADDVILRLALRNMKQLKKGNK